MAADLEHTSGAGWPHAGFKAARTGCFLNRMPCSNPDVRSDSQFTVLPGTETAENNILVSPGCLSFLAITQRRYRRYYM